MQSVEQVSLTEMESYPLVTMLYDLHSKAHDLKWQRLCFYQEQYYAALNEKGRDAWEDAYRAAANMTSIEQWVPESKAVVAELVTRGVLVTGTHV